MTPGRPDRKQHRARLTAVAWLVALWVVLLHGGLVTQLAWLTRHGAEAAGPAPQRLSALFVRTLQPTGSPAYDVAPLVAVPSAPPAAPGGMVLLPIPAVDWAASAPPTSPPAPEVEAQVEAQVEPPPPSPSRAPDPSAGPQVATAPAPPAEGASAPAFEWPPSTRLRYVLTGHYRGPIDGTAQVEWVRQGSRYQVHLDVAIGLTFAPLISREMHSDGDLGPTGLVPRRYDERTRVLFGAPSTAALRFDGQQVRLANGRRTFQPPGVQDSVSQFVQLTWRFLQQPSLLQAGQVLEVPLALPRRVGTWVYDVRAAETLSTPVGAVEAVHVQPRPSSRRAGELAAEMWFAPGLQYLPVRILIRQNEDTYVDLLIDQLPLQALEPPTSVPLKP